MRLYSLYWFIERNFISSVIKSRISYCGATSISEMQSKAKFIRLTQSAIFEHDINKLNKLQGINK